MIDMSVVRESLQRMEDHELVSDYKRGAFSDEARRIAEELMLQRGIDPANPRAKDDSPAAETSHAKYRPRFIPALYGAFAAASGAAVGAAFAGAIGSGVAAAAFAVFGWWVGERVAHTAHRATTQAGRLLLLVGATPIFLVVCAVVMVFGRVIAGRV